MRAPKHTAEEVAERLREDISGCSLLIARIEESRRRVADDFQDRIEAEGSPKGKQLIMGEWSHSSQNFALELAAAQAREGDLRRILQWLTGELWS